MRPPASFIFDKQLNQAEDRVGRGAAIKAGVQIAGRSARLDLHINQSAQADVQRRQTRRIHFRVGDQSATSAFSFAAFFATYSATEMPPTSSSPSIRNFRLTGSLPFTALQRFDGLDVRIHLAFVVGRAARIEIAVALGRLEGRRLPELQRIGRLHVEVTVAEHGGLAGRVKPIGIDQRMPFGFDEFDIFETGGLQLCRHEFGGAMRVFSVVGQRGDAGDAKEFL